MTLQEAQLAKNILLYLQEQPGAVVLLSALPERNSSNKVIVDTILEALDRKNLVSLSRADLPTVRITGYGSELCSAIKADRDYRGKMGGEAYLQHLQLNSARWRKRNPFVNLPGELLAYSSARWLLVLAILFLIVYALLRYISF